MLKRKTIKSKGKISFTRYFQEFKPGERVSLVRDMAFKRSFPYRAQGRTGIITGQRGAAYVIEVTDGGMKKQFMVKPIHLKKLDVK